MIVTITGCENGEVNTPTICLSFDDNYVNEWVELLPLLDEYDAKVTFFVCRLGEYSDREKDSLRKLIDHGHEIGAHGEMHVSVNQYIKSHGIFSYLRNEIQSNVDQIKQYGVTPRFFALPYGEHNKMVNLLLWFKFEGIRDVIPTSSYENALIDSSINKWISRFWVGSLELDNGNFNTIPWKNIVKNVTDNETRFLVHLHKVGDGDAYELSEERFRLLLQWGKDNGFKFSRFGDVF
ncbi:polysaccharide deacetylase family protein [Lunatibacter salilacus]|uniref:polysaccharide deacetylase family protein n=1 Tax=Lunatibacter salilacus TaxID=2483804 RepID=UPI00131D74C5|nr:polysaccharide deacetylase family protein [Lunatibacter salilacus]